MSTTGQKIKRALELALVGGSSVIIGAALENHIAASYMYYYSTEIEKPLRIWPQETELWRQMPGFEHVFGAIVGVVSGVMYPARASASVQSLSRAGRIGYYGAVVSALAGTVLAGGNIHGRMFISPRREDGTFTTTMTAIPISDFVFRGQRKEQKLLIGYSAAFPDVGVTFTAPE